MIRVNLGFRMNGRDVILLPNVSMGVAIAFTDRRTLPKAASWWVYDCFRAE